MGQSPQTPLQRRAGLLFGATEVTALKKWLKVSHKQHQGCTKGWGAQGGCVQGCAVQHRDPAASMEVLGTHLAPPCAPPKQGSRTPGQGELVTTPGSPVGPRPPPPTAEPTALRDAEPQAGVRKRSHLAPWHGRELGGKEVKPAREGGYPQKTSPSSLRHSPGQAPAQEGAQAAPQRQSSGLPGGSCARLRSWFRSVESLMAANEVSHA